MKPTKLIIISITLLIMGISNTSTAASLEELTNRVENLEKENQKLRQDIRQTDVKLNAAADSMESISSMSQSLLQKTQLGGYGELHYNNLQGEGGASDKSQIDFHRFVLFLSHDFTNSVKFHSELEIEHSISGDGQPGEVELEQAYIDFLINDHFNVRGGLFLIPVGIMNETHEPPTFYGVERNPVEKNIIPATWWEGGAGIYGSILPTLTYDLYLHSGLETSGPDYKIRSGRQKVGNASAENFAGTARIKWDAFPGLTLAASYQYQDDITQESDPEAGNAQLFETHAAWSHGPFGLRALYAHWELDGDGPKASGADEQSGFYVEPSFKICSQVGLFARYNQWDNQAGSNSDSEKVQWDVGINYWPHPNVVVKADYQIQDNDNDKNQDGFNLGIGYQF